MRSHYCGQVNESLIGQTVTVAGWVNRRRDHGGVIFVDLRDREGLVQVVCDPDAPELFAEAERLREKFAEIDDEELESAGPGGGGGPHNARHRALLAGRAVRTDSARGLRREARLPGRHPYEAKKTNNKKNINQRRNKSKQTKPNI
jgi:hypothetical protein